MPSVLILVPNHKWHSRKFLVSDHNYFQPTYHVLTCLSSCCLLKLFHFYTSTSIISSIISFIIQIEIFHCANTHFSSLQFSMTQFHFEILNSDFFRLNIYYICFKKSFPNFFLTNLTIYPPTLMPYILRKASHILIFFTSNIAWTWGDGGGLHLWHSSLSVSIFIVWPKFLYFEIIYTKFTKSSIFVTYLSFKCSFMLIIRSYPCPKC